MRVGILTSHPIQYQAPWFRALAAAVDLEVFFCHRQSAAEQGRAGFGVAFNWDIDLLSGYRHRFLKNVAAKPGVNHFAGCDTPEIREVIRGGNFDGFIVSGWQLKAYWQAVRACRAARVPVFVRGDSQLRTPRSRLKRLLKEVVYRPLLRQFDGFLVVGERNKEYLAHYGVPGAKMFPVRHFVDNEWFAARANEASGQRVALRKEWGAGADDRVALFIGKFIPLKRPADFVGALAGLKERNVKNVGVFVGAGELEPELRQRAAQTGVRAHFAGFKNQSQLPACYAAADVLVLPSDSETWGLVVNEAMACGTPAIVSDAVGCVPDLIVEGKTGFTYPCGNVPALVSALEKMVQLRREGFDFPANLATLMNRYSVAAAVRGTVDGVQRLVDAKRQT